MAVNTWISLLMSHWLPSSVLSVPRGFDAALGTVKYYAAFLMFSKFGKPVVLDSSYVPVRIFSVLPPLVPALQGLE